jgi:sugar transferase (PEP-CTERM/EpsH1 system associated)
MRPHIVHTRNLAPLEACLPAWAAGVPVRVHGEHGWDVGDLDGSNRGHQLARRLYRPFVSHYVALSSHIEDYLRKAVGVPAGAVTHIYNGVDTQRFSAVSGRASVDGSPFNDSGFWVFGTVGRLTGVKDQAALVSALARAHRSSPEAQARMRLVIVGDGPLREELSRLARDEGVADAVWFTGARSDIARVMTGLDAFVLPSLAEGISNTLLEAMSCARPVIATAVGGNAELIEQGLSGTLVPASDPRALDAALQRYFREPDTARRHGAAARATVEARFSLERMVADYAALYERLAVPVLGADARASMQGATLKPGEGH